MTSWGFLQSDSPSCPASPVTPTKKSNPLTSLLTEDEPKRMSGPTTDQVLASIMERLEELTESVTVEIHVKDKNVVRNSA